MFSPRISVVIPCYNHGRFLRDAIESIGTPVRSVEVVVVDDGSTDETPETAEEMAANSGGHNRQVRVFRQANSGISGARNRGLEEARGRYVVFLDADDRLAPGALDIGTRTCDAHPDSAFVFGRCQMMSADGALLPTPVQPRIDRHHYTELLRRNYIWTPATVMFRRDVVEHARGFDTSLNGSAEYDLYLRLARNYPVHDHAQIVAYCRRHPATISGNASVMLREILAVLRSQEPFLEGDPEAWSAYCEGRRSWQDYYGNELVNEIRAHVRTGAWIAAARKALALGVIHPLALSHYAHGKLGSSPRGLSRRPQLQR